MLSKKRRWWAVWAALVAVPVAAAPRDQAALVQPAVAAGRVVAWPNLDGGAAGPMSVWVWLPAAYDRQLARRFPVLYMHDGQNLFDPALATFGKDWGLDEALTRMARDGWSRDWIVVGVQSPRSRYDTLFPARLLPFLPPAFRQRVRSLDSGDPKGPLASADYLRFLVGPVKRRVDASFRTRPGRADTAVMGSSMGGLMAFYAMSEYPEVFGQAAAVSIHVALASPLEKGIDHAARADEVAAAFAAYLKASRVDPAVNRLYIDHGTGTLDGSYGPYSTALLPVLRARGWRDGPNFMFRTFSGAQHDEVAWRERVDLPLLFLDRRPATLPCSARLRRH